MSYTNIWKLTRSVNDYNQHGEYYVGAWSHEPTDTELLLAGLTLYDLATVRDGTNDEYTLERDWTYEIQPAFVRIAEAFDMRHEVVTIKVPKDLFNPTPPKKKPKGLRIFNLRGADGFEYVISNSDMNWRKLEELVEMLKSYRSE